MEQQQGGKHFTYEDYLSWNTENRCEIVGGVVFAMAGASTSHQRLSRNLNRIIDSFLDGKPCEVFQAPYDVRFSEDNKTDTVVQPDLLVVCQKEKIRNDGIVGAPTLIIEILSPSTASYDFIVKRNLYERNGVEEYWIVSPDEKSVTRMNLVDGRYDSERFVEGTIESKVLFGLSIDLKNLFSVLA